MHDGLNPEPEDFRAALERFRQLWSWVFATPLIYGLIAWILLSKGLVMGAHAAVHPLDTPAVRLGLGLVAVAIGAVMVLVRLRRAGSVRRALPDRLHALRRYSWNYFTTLCLSDALSLLGLIYFCISGRVGAVLAAGLLTFAGYFLSYPRQDDLAPLTEDE